MRIGFFTHRYGDVMDSVSHVWRSTFDLLKRHHELRPQHYPFASTRHEDLLQDWISQCDLVLGPIDPEVLRAREKMDRPIPYILFLLGTMSRGGLELRGVQHRLRTYDVLVGNCESDAALATKFFPNATVRAIPFGYDESAYSSIDDDQRRASREELGIPPDGPLLLYAGRITLEKNLHTLLKVFRVVLNAEPKARLIIAGSEWFAPFGLYGVFPLGISRTLQRLMSHLGLDERVVRFVGHQNTEQLRNLFGAADVLLNFTLHHDENFGLVQIEAMACGLPVVGTAWGGLKDTITDGVTGAQVPAVATTAGVKVDWWSAGNSIVQQLARSRADPGLRRRISDAARERYAMSRYGEHLERVIADAVAATALAMTTPILAAHTASPADLPRATAATAGEPLRTSPFADEYWSHYVPAEEVPYRRGPRALELYREMITAFAGAPTNGHGEDSAKAWCLAAPLTIDEDDQVLVNDLIYPLKLDVPPPMVAHVRALISQFADQPVIPTTTFREAGDAANEALAWMHDAGLLLTTPRGSLDLACARGALGQPVFVIRHVDRRTDVVWLS